MPRGGMPKPNEYEVRGDIAVIFLRRKNDAPLEAIVDAADLGLVLSHPRSWWANVTPYTAYAQSCMPCRVREPRRLVQMHRLIMGFPDGYLIDHRNGNGLDNRRANLRLADSSLNTLNMAGARRDSSSGIRGVAFHKASGLWIACGKVNKKQTLWASFHSVEEAIAARHEWEVANGIADLRAA